MPEREYAKLRHYRITSENIVQKSPDDCILPENDPAIELMKQAYLGGLGYTPPIDAPAFPQSDNKGKIQRENNIKPGSKEWFDLWFPRN